MGWQWGSIPLLLYMTESNPVIVSAFLLITDGTPLLMTDNTGMFLAGGP